MKKKSFRKIRIIQQWIFPLAVVILIIFISGFIIYSSGFLISHLNKALNVDVKAASPIQFDIEGFEKLNLVRLK
ncbi:MAG: hypothetical protein QMD65_01080 [Patescibacteria group bacterium]|nr:hypothetical protein [Patescibacteria group bacterium]